jgi:chromosome segregation ATPase
MDSEKLQLTQPRKELIEGIQKISSTKTSTKIPKEPAWTGFGNHWITISAVLVIAGLLVFAYLLNDSYKKGLNAGVASTETGLTFAQRTLQTQSEQISQLQNDLGEANKNVIQMQRELDKNRRELESANRQKAQLAQDLKEVRSRSSGRVSDVKQSYENRIRKITADHQRKVKSLMKRPQQVKIDEISAQLAASQTGLETAKTEIQGKVQVIGKLEGELLKTQTHADRLQQQLSQTQQALEAARQENVQLQEYVPMWMRDQK